MKIAIVHTTLSFPGGAEKQLMHLARELKRQNHEVIIFTFVEDQDSRIFKEICPTLVVETCKRIKGNPLEYVFRLQSRTGMWLSLAKELADKIRNSNFDIVNYHNSPVLTTSLFLQRKGLVHIWTCNDLPHNELYSRIPALVKLTRISGFILRYMKRETLVLFDNLLKGGFFRLRIFTPTLYQYIIRNRLDGIITNSRRTLHLLQHFYGRQGVTVTPGVDIASISQGNFIQLYHPDTRGQGVATLLVVSSLESRSKRIEDAIMATKYLTETGLHVQLVVVGNGKLLSLYRYIAKQANISERVFFIGYVPEGTLNQLYNTSHVLIFPAVNQSWGMVPFEAMAAGLPVVVSEDTGAAEIIQRHALGIVVPPKRPDMIAKAVFKILNDAGFRESCRDRARRFVQQTLSWESYARRTSLFFVELLKNAPKINQKPD